jgi:hypothetical protein
VLGVSGGDTASWCCDVAVAVVEDCAEGHR